MRYGTAFLVAFLGSLALTASALAQDMAQKVTLRSPAKSAKALLAELSQSTGVAMTTAPQTAGEILLLSVTNVPLKDLMNKIAEAAGAEWQQDSAGWRLIRSQGLANKQDRELLEARAARIRAEIEKIAKSVAAQPRWTAAEARRAYEGEAGRGAVAPAPSLTFQLGQEMGQQRFEMPRSRPNSPVARALSRVLVGMNPADLASLAAGTRTVFALGPTRAQRPLPGKAVAAMQSFATEQALYAQSNSEGSAAEGAGPRWALRGQDSRAQWPAGGVAECLFVVTRRADADSLQCELKVADREGRFFAQASRSINPRASDGQPSAASGAAIAEKPLQISEPGTQHATLLSRAFAGGDGFRFVSTSGGDNVFMTVASSAALTGTATPASAPIEAAAEWRERLARPDLFEPLGFAVSDLYLSYTAALGGNLVACLPDSVLMPLSRRSLQTLTPAELARISRADLGLGIRTADGWTVVTPRFPSLSRSTRIDRGALASMIAGIVRQGRLALDTLGAYALRRPTPPARGAFDTTYVALIDRRASGTLVESGFNWKMIQLYSSLDQARRKALSDGAIVRLGSLSKYQFDLVDSMVYDDPNGAIRVQPPQRQAPVGRGRGQRQREVFEGALVMAGDDGSMMTFSTGGSASIMDERTEFLPDGLPAQGSMVMRWSRQLAAYATRSANPGDGQFLSAESYGAMTGFAQGSNARGEHGLPQYDRFQPGSIVTMQFTFALPSQGTMQRELRDETVSEGSRLGTYEELPQAYRQEVERARRRAAEASRRVLERAPTPPGRPGNIPPL